MIPYRETTVGITFTIRVQPGAPRTKIIGEYDGALKIAVAAPPVEGKANAECLRFLAKLFDVSRSEVTIITGETGRTKVVRIGGLSVQQFEEHLSTV